MTSMVSKHAKFTSRIKLFKQQFPGLKNIGKAKFRIFRNTKSKGFSKLQALSLTGLFQCTIELGERRARAIGKYRDIIMLATGQLKAAAIWPFWQGHHPYKVLTLGLTCSFGPVPSVLLSKGALVLSLWLQCPFFNDSRIILS